MALFDFPSRAAWLLLTAAGVIAYGGLLALGVAVELQSLAVPGAIICACLAVQAFYGHVRPDRRIATMMAAAAFMIALGATEGALTYPAAALGWPLQDQAFVQFERAFGLDWPKIAGALSMYGWLNAIWAIAYLSSLPQIPVAVIALAIVDRHERLATYLTLLATTLLCTIALSALLPAIGPIPTFAIQGDEFRRLGEGGKSFLSDFYALRGGRFAIFDLARLEGIITFPSFHCVLAILTAWALAPLRWIGIPFVLLNVLVIISTVPQGGHYLADVVAGCAIAGLPILMLAWRKDQPTNTLLPSATAAAP